MPGVDAIKSAGEIMSEETIKRCDLCGARQQTANGWLRFSPKPRKFTAYGPKEKPKEESVKDACGRECLVKAFSKWLEETHVNAPVEIKKDEIQNQ